MKVFTAFLVGFFCSIVILWIGVLGTLGKKDDQ